MSYQKKVSVAWGELYGGLSTVGYQLYDSDGTPNGSRTTTGVYELRTNSGCYAVLLTLADGWQGMIEWDSGDADLVYGYEDLGGLQQLTAAYDASKTAAQAGNQMTLTSGAQSAMATAAATAILVTPANKLATGTSGEVTPEAVDGIDAEVAFAAMLAHALGESEVVDNVVTFKRRDGSTVATVTMGTTAGERTASVLEGE